MNRFKFEVNNVLEDPWISTYKMAVHNAALVINKRQRYLNKRDFTDFESDKLDKERTIWD